MEVASSGMSRACDDPRVARLIEARQRWMQERDATLAVGSATGEASSVAPACCLVCASSISAISTCGHNVCAECADACPHCAEGPVGSLEQLTQRLQIAEQALADCKNQTEAFEELTRAYHASVRKIDEKINRLQEERTLLDTEYRSSRVRHEQVLAKEKALTGLVVSLRREMRLKEILNRPRSNDAAPSCSSPTGS
ncbi:hypothetical protein GMRT_14092 [Giardia muris]|uniref:RING-type domain-containing protein n=1 Tax=Giardia muris TaxID=5742 RepID=A0A4Z1T448_GIAMU|nr:hypothetical protein GMRT_14092 [Giardia muris]|eukprot:TNJ30428.1 hypothetical protein GMRT_14092 [Giardia muris]